METGTAAGRHPWERPLDPQIGRLVLLTSSRSSDTITELLPPVLARLRTLGPTQSIADAFISSTLFEATYPFRILFDEAIRY